MAGSILLVSNAGGLRAGGLEEMTLQNFEFVTRIKLHSLFPGDQIRLTPDENPGAL
jgi:hypothetical protein